MDSETQLRIATRIHYALLRHLGTGIDVGSMLSRKAYAREVIYVCEGCSDAELNALGREFTAARRAARGERPMPSLQRRHVPASIPMLPVTAVVPIQPSWANDSSILDSRQPPEEPPLADTPRKRWFSPSRWRRREPDETSG